MRHMKLFEDFDDMNNGPPQLWDYVICNENDIDVDDFFDKNIGQIIYIYDGVEFPYKVKFETKNDKILSFNRTRDFNESEIIYHSKNKEDLQLIIDSEKYNL